MRKLIFLLFGLLFFNLGCDDGSVGGGGRVKVVATLQTPLQIGGPSPLLNSFTIDYGPQPHLIRAAYWDGGFSGPSPLIFTTDEYSVTQGQNFGIRVQLNTFDVVCHQVIVETFLNGTLFDTRTLNMGGA